MSEKGLIPKISPSNFRYDNWDAAAPLKFSESYYTDFLDSVVGWCEASKVYCRPKNDDENIAVLFSDGVWCHLNFFYLFSYSDGYNYFERFEGLDKKTILDYIAKEKWGNLIYSLEEK